MKKGSIFALVINNNKSVDKTKRWCCSSVWLECLPVTQEVASSSLVSTAEGLSEMRDFFRFIFLPYFVHEIALIFTEMFFVEKLHYFITVKNSASLRLCEFKNPRNYTNLHENVFSLKTPLLHYYITPSLSKKTLRLCVF